MFSLLLLFLFWIWFKLNTVYVSNFLNWILFLCSINDFIYLFIIMFCFPFIQKCLILESPDKGNWYDVFCCFACVVLLYLFWCLWFEPAQTKFSWTFFWLESVCISYLYHGHWSWFAGGACSLSRSEPHRFGLILFGSWFDLFVILRKPIVAVCFAVLILLNKK